MAMDEDLIVINEQVPAVIVASGDGIIAGPQGVRGEQGFRGFAGYSVLNGTTDPVGTVGQNGDFYINTTTNRIFGPKSGGLWGTGKSLVGPPGPQGPDGPTGPAGPAGTVSFAGTGTATTAARSDHTHDAASSGEVWRTSGGYGGATPPAGATLWKQFGTASGTIGGGNGSTTISWPQAFPTGLVGVVATLGAQTANAATVSVIGGSTNRTAMTVIVRQPNGAVVADGQSVRINFFAVGW